MGTRGLWGFRKNGHDKVRYRQFDCYPGGLGGEMILLLKLNGYGRLNDYFDRIIEIDAKQIPKDSQKSYCRDMGWFDRSVSTQSDDDWYCLLRGLQYPNNSFQDAIDEDNVVFLNNEIDFIKDSLMCEYAYIFDLDSKKLEVYAGFQNEPFDGNRYGIEKNDSGYYPCRQICSLPYNLIQSFGKKMLVRLIEIADEETPDFTELNDHPEIGAEIINGVVNYSIDLGKR